jgi:hypothetical protein
MKNAMKHVSTTARRPLLQETITKIPISENYVTIGAIIPDGNRPQRAGLAPARRQEQREEELLTVPFALTGDSWCYRPLAPAIGRRVDEGISPTRRLYDQAFSSPMAPHHPKHESIVLF